MINELEIDAIDALVFKVENPDYEGAIPNDYKPTLNWSQGGEIVGREGIGFERVHIDGNDMWRACSWHVRLIKGSCFSMAKSLKETGFPVLERTEYSYGKTQLIAAMRCYLNSKVEQVKIVNGGVDFEWRK